MDKKRDSTYEPPAFLGKWMAGGGLAESYPSVPEKHTAMPARRGPLAMAFIVPQEWEETYEPAVGFERGTIFPALDLPFAGEGGCRYD